MKYDIISALQTLRPGAKWVVRGDTYSGLEWLDTEQQCPTDEELQVEVARLQAEYDALEYQRLRKKAYPSIQDQLDELYHNGYEGWHATITAVKTEFPKG